MLSLEKALQFGDDELIAKVNAESILCKFQAESVDAIARGIAESYTKVGNITIYGDKTGTLASDVIDKTAQHSDGLAKGQGRPGHIVGRVLSPSASFCYNMRHDTLWDYMGTDPANLNLARRARRSCGRGDRHGFGR